MNKSTILIVEDNRSLAVAMAAAAENAGLKAELAPTLARARQALDKYRFAGLLLDIGLPDGHGLELINDWAWDHKPEIAVITAHGEIENAIAARKLGIAHFLDKPVDFESLESFFQTLGSRTPPNPTGKTESHPTPFVGASPVMRPVFRQISHACASTQPVVITGASGTGKSHVAGLIAQSGPTPAKLETIHASSLLEAHQLEQALDRTKGSTLILESVHTLQSCLQDLLVSSIDQQEAPRLVVTSDDTGLLTKVEQGAFNRELCFRLQVLEVKLPPLKERNEDIPALTDCFLGELNKSSHARIDEHSLSALCRYDWPGNVRELRNTIQHAIITSAGQASITLDHLPPHLATPQTHRLSNDEDLEYALKLWLDKQLETGAHYKQVSARLERLLLRILLDRYDGKPSRLAAALSINRSTLRKKLKQASEE
ncbi:sigma-54-dependent Fis family transcriptional regulator [Verrucomicrobiaceae bacterium N1E253]|uniref:DNA-binding transcriptional regulator NtrC n=1 Tax=Oceaniferula marina TaxID=2748318 RepID=A0A851GD35_9BACT|nr:response regulator [Oceaniferula marina]NWK54852.1 sigma-54-dependent Fis family transcriptional regulator [Oceaniferula marina]